MDYTLRQRQGMFVHVQSQQPFTFRVDRRSDPVA